MAKSKVVIKTEGDITISGDSTFAGEKKCCGEHRLFLVICLLLIALVLAIIVYFNLRYIYPDCFRFHNSDSSIIIAALTLLTSVLIGFQIWSIINLDKRFAEQRESIATEFKEQIESYGLDSAGLSLLTIGVYNVKVEYQKLFKENSDSVKKEELSKSISLAAYLLFQSLVILSLSKKRGEIGESAWDTAILNLVKLINDHNKKKIDLIIWMPRSMKIACLNAAKEIEDNGERELIFDFLESEAIRPTNEDNS